MEIIRKQPAFCIGIMCSAGGMESTCDIFQQVVEKPDPHGIPAPADIGRFLLRYLGAYY
jgi:hypothetical protein